MNKVISEQKDTFLISDLYAKPEVPLLCHLLEVGYFTEAILKYGPGKSIITRFSNLYQIPEEDLISNICFLCAAHDIGKAHPAFQKQIRGEEGFQVLKEFHMISKKEENMEIRHERYSPIILQDYFKKAIEIPQEYFDLIAFHHQGKEVKTFSKEISHPEAKEWQLLQKELLDTLFTLWPVSKKIPVHKKYYQAFTTGILSVMITADWFASGKLWQDYKTEHDEVEIKTLIHYFLDKQKLINQPTFDELVKEKSFSDLFGFSPNKLQNACIELAKTPFQLMIIESLCGIGKTEAGLISAVMAGIAKNGLYMAMPTNATTENMLPRIRTMMEKFGVKDSIPKYNSTAFFSDNDEDMVDSGYMVHDKRMQMLYPSAVGTIDQLLKTISCYRYSPIGLLGLMNKVIIIDEIHAYDAYLRTKIERLLEYCHFFQIPVIMLSATLDDKTKCRYMKAAGGHPVKCSTAYPLITTVADGVITETPVEAKGKQIPFCLKYVEDMESTLKEAATKTDNCKVIIAPTVDTAISTYQTLSEETIQLFHSRDTISQKQRKANELFCLYGKNSTIRPKKSICIATSILEMSLDISFDTMVTALCPIDSFIQRIGRIHRHDKEDITIPIEILIPKDLSKNTVYDKTILEATVATLSKRTTFDTVKDIREMINDVYVDIDKLEDRQIKEQDLFQEESEINQNKKDTKENQTRLSAQQNILPSPISKSSIFDYTTDNYLQFSPKTISIRFSKYPSTEIALITKSDIKADEFETAKHILTNYTVSVPDWYLKSITQETIKLPYLENVKVYMTDNYELTSKLRTIKLTEKCGLLLEKNY